MADWTRAKDDQLTERWRACLLCGHRVGWLAIVEVAGLAWGGGLCPRCYSIHGLAAVDQGFEQRAQRLQQATKNNND